MSKRETVLKALFSVLQNIGDVKVERNSELPETTDEKGLLIMRDGEIEEMEVVLSPLLYSWQHTVQIEVFIKEDINGKGEMQRDDLLKKIDQAFSADETLSGNINGMTVARLDPGEISAKGSAVIKAATISVELFYDSDGILK